MRREVLYGVIAVLVVAVGVLGWMVWDAQREPEGVEIRLDDKGISIERE